MENRSISWVGSLSDIVLDSQARSFSKTEVMEQDNLFAHRAALFYTPTSNIPEEFVSSGDLILDLPIPSPDYTEIYELKSYRTPRFWVDLIQRQTFKIRWRPFLYSQIIITRYDYYTIRSDHVIYGLKALEDALKVSTYGRRDGKPLYYFGAITEDDGVHSDFSINQQNVDHPSLAKLHIEVRSQ